MKTESWQDINERILAELRNGEEVHVGEWQAIQNPDMPQATTLEAQDISFKLAIPEHLQDLQELVEPNLPWAEEHFQERISGIPYNPPPSHVRWPFAQQNNSEHMSDEKFSHTYPERMWPMFARDGFKGGDTAMQGIRYGYGDLKDVIRLLQARPGTRQAYLPIWFPEDTGAVEGQRVPCTLGYHFLVRSGRLKIVYYIRSCDYYRHFRDDVYMAARLGQYVSSQLAVPPVDLVMHISSMHVFAAEKGRLEQDLNIIRYKESRVVSSS